VDQLTVNENTELDRFLTEKIKLMILEQERIKLLYPKDIPNEVCNHAIISGIKVENSPGFKVNEYTPLLTIGDESIFVWTHTKNAYSSIVSEVRPKVKNLGYWKNAGHLFKLSLAYYYLFESINEMKYHWIYYFEKTNPFEGSDFLNKDHLLEGTLNGSVMKVSFFNEISFFIELLIRDDKFFTAFSIFLNSIETHWFCFHCELSKIEHKMHPSHEPEKWEEAEIVPKMDSAIVQSCRAVEAILGKPGNRDNQMKIARVKERWRSIVDLDPDDIFWKTGSTYFDYYYILFELRNNSAHSFGELPFKVSKELTIEAQCFSFLILEGYISLHRIDQEEAKDRLKLNMELISREVLDFSTKKTYE
jgi:hypothetical protein